MHDPILRKRTARVFVASFEEFFPADAEFSLGLIDLLANPCHVLRLLRESWRHSLPAAEGNARAEPLSSVPERARVWPECRLIAGVWETAQKCTDLRLLNKR